MSAITLISLIQIFFVTAKRSKQSSSEARKNAAAGIEASLFSKIVEEAGLQLNSDATQDELGK